jgi:tetratricopeptide (TPR) repeat protein
LNESTQKQLLEALRETRGVAARKTDTAIGIRVSPAGYFALAALLTFVSVILLRTHKDFAALLLVTSTWIFIPALVATDRLYFDGQILFRSGFLPLIARLARGRRPQLGVADIERVEVGTVRTLRRGGSVRYRYRVEISGKGQIFAFASGGRKFRTMINNLLPRIADEKLDARAAELRDYLCDPKTLRKQVEEMGIATPSVLEQADETTRKRIERQATAEQSCSEPDNGERAQSLRQVANNLRVAGRLRESAEGFRRALHLAPRDSWMLYEYARLLRSQASAFSDARLLTRACAALKLSLSRAGDDARLAERIGESFLEFGQPERAAKVLRQAIELDQNSFRAYLTLAEIALAEGKLAHVIHHYRDAARVARDQATARMARQEADYYARLNDDDDYLNSELRRMTWLDGAGRVQQLAARVSFAALFIALTGSLVNQLVAGAGWAVASSSIISWSGALVLRRILARRRETNLKFE